MLKLTTLTFLIASVFGLHYTLDAINVWYATPRLSIAFDVWPPSIVGSPKIPHLATVPDPIPHPLSICGNQDGVWACDKSGATPSKAICNERGCVMEFFEAPPEETCPSVEDILHRPDRRNPIPHGTFWFPGPEMTI